MATARKQSRASRSDTVQVRLHELITNRLALMERLQAWHEQHEAVFDRQAELQEAIDSLDTSIKDLLRSQYHDGSKRGIYKIYDEAPLFIQATVKYGRDTVEVADLLERYPSAGKIKGLIKTQQTVDLEVLDQAIQSGDIGDDVLDLLEPGPFMTPSITIKNKLPSSTTEEDPE
jgi:hypothetical protein